MSMSLPLPLTSYHHGVGSFRLVVNLVAWFGCAVGFWLLGSVAGPAAGALMFLPVIVTAGLGLGGFGLVFGRVFSAS